MDNWVHGDMRHFNSAWNKVADNAENEPYCKCAVKLKKREGEPARTNNLNRVAKMTKFSFRIWFQFNMKKKPTQVQVKLPKLIKFISPRHQMQRNVKSHWLCDNLQTLYSKHDLLSSISSSPSNSCILHGEVLMTGIKSHTKKPHTESNLQNLALWSVT